MQKVQNANKYDQALEAKNKRSITEARSDFGNIVRDAEYLGESFIISRHGKPAAAVVPIHVYKNWQRSRKKFFDLIRQLQQEANLEPQEAEDLASEAVSAVRAETRRKI